MVRFVTVFTELVRVEIELWNELDAHLDSAVGVSLSQFQALSAIKAADGSARVQDISSEMIITVGAASKVVDRLERDGLAQRSAHPTDRRSSIVSLTERGGNVLAEADAAAEELLSAALGAVLPQARRESLLMQLIALRANARSEFAK